LQVEKELCCSITSSPLCYKVSDTPVHGMKLRELYSSPQQNDEKTYQRVSLRERFYLRNIFHYGNR